MALRKRLRLVIAAGAALAVALSLTGCGSSDSKESSGDSTTLVWNMWTGSTAEVENWNHVAKMVTAKYPDIQLKFQTTSFNDYWTKLAAQASGGDEACILGVQSLRAASVAQLLMPLDDKLSGAGIDTSQFNDTIVRGLQVDGKQLAIPYDFGPLVMYYNVDRFKQAGLQEPSQDWTLDDFMKDAKTLTSGGKYGFAAYPTIDSVIPWSLSLHKAQPFTSKGGLQLTSPGFTKATQWYSDLVDKEKVAPPVAATSDPTPALSSFIAGDSAMTVDGPWQLVNVADQAKFKVGVAPIPSGPGGSHSQVAGSGFGISKNCKYVDKAMKAISVITGPTAEKYLAESGRAYPARTAQQKYWFKPSLAGAKEGLDTAIARSVAVPNVPTYTQVSQVFTQYGIQAMNGQMDVPTFLKNVQSQAGG